MKKLNLGCGNDYKKGWVNLDSRKNVRSDITHNLNKFPYPFKESYFDEILLENVLEHLENPIKVLKELIRISRNNARIIVSVPHATAYTNKSDIQHKTNFTEHTFTQEHLKEYELEQLILKNQEFIFFYNWKKIIPFKKYLKIFFNGLYDNIKFEFLVRK